MWIWVWGVLFFCAPFARAQGELPFPVVQTYRDQEKILDAFAHLQTDSSPEGPLEGDNPRWWAYPGPTEIDKDLGVYNRPSIVSRQIKRTKTRLLYDAIATHDPYGRRWTGAEKSKAVQNFVALLGCSLTYGEGLNDRETLAYYLNSLLEPNHYVYNYGSRGSGPNTYLALLESGRLRREVPESKGLFIYVSLDSIHIFRSTGRLPDLQWLGTTPYYKRQGDHLLRQRDFNSGRPWITRALLAYNDLITWWGGSPAQEFPRLFARDYEFHCTMVKQMRDQVQKQFPGSRFVVYAHPLVRKISQASLDCYRNNQIPVYLSAQEWKGDEWYLPDRHPAAVANKKIADELRDVVLKEGI